MSNAYTATSDLNSLPKYYNKVFLERLVPIPVMMDAALKKPLPGGAGTTAYFPRMTNSSTTVSAYKITQGTVISTEKIADVQVSAVVETFGNAKALWDLTELTAINGEVEETVKEIAQQAGNVIDKRIMETAYGTSAAAWGGGFSVQFADLTVGTDYGVTSAAYALTGTSKAITAAMIRKWVKILRARQVLPGSDGLFTLFVHSDTEMTIQADSTWQAAYQNTDPEMMRKGLFGIYGGVKMQRDNNIFTSANGSSGAMLYYSILVGEGALGVTELDGGIKTYAKKSGDQDTSNPINQFITFGWKIFFVPVMLNVSCGLICVTSDQ